MIQTIINGRLVDSPRRQLSGWDVPISSAQDVSFAIKCMRASEGVPLKTAIEVIEAIGSEGSWIGEEDLKAIVQRTGTAMKYLRLSIRRANGWMARIGEYVRSQGDVANGFLTDRGVQWVGGLPTALILAGDSSSLAAVAMSHVLLAGGNAVVKASSVEALSPFRFVSALRDKGIKQTHLVYFDSSVEAERELVRTVVGTCAQSIVYGEDGTVAKIYGAQPNTAAHKPIPYWSGRSGALVLPDADPVVAARHIVYGLHEDRGNRCSSTKKVLVPEAMASRLMALMVQEADKLRRGDPLDEETDIGRLDEAARKQALAAVGAGEVVYDRDLLILRVDEDCLLLREELPFPVLAVRTYREDEDPVRILNRHVAATPSGRSLVIAVMSQSKASFERAASGLRAYKVLWNRPTTETDLFVPHQGIHQFKELLRPRVLCA